MQLIFVSDMCTAQKKLYFPHLLLLSVCGEVLGGFMFRNAATNQLQLAQSSRKQHGGWIPVLGLDGIWHLSPKNG